MRILPVAVALEIVRIATQSGIDASYESSIPRDVQELQGVRAPVGVVESPPLAPEVDVSGNESAVLLGGEHPFEAPEGERRIVHPAGLQHVALGRVGDVAPES